MEGSVGLGGWLHTKINVLHQELYPKTVTHPSTNRAHCRLTSLTETNVLRLRQTTRVGNSLGEMFGFVSGSFVAELSRVRVQIPGLQVPIYSSCNLGHIGYKIHTHRRTDGQLLTGYNIRSTS